MNERRYNHPFSFFFKSKFRIDCALFTPCEFRLASSFDYQCAMKHRVLQGACEVQPRRSAFEPDSREFLVFRGAL